MDTIRDLTWVKHLRMGKVIERMTLGPYRIVSLSIPSSDQGPPEQYLFRMLFFPTLAHQPVLALNLELSILGSSCLTEHAGSRHARFDTLEAAMSYDEFRRWALARAEEVLGLRVVA
jgi:hypothetical protein